MPGADTDTGEAAQSVSEAENTPAAPLIDYDSDPSLDNSNAATPVASNASATNPRGAGTKRKKGHQAITSRSVASLTPEQLEKKRKNDREVRTLFLGCSFITLFSRCLCGMMADPDYLYHWLDVMFTHIVWVEWQVST